VLVADQSVFIIRENVTQEIGKVGQEDLYVHSANVGYMLKNILGTYDDDY
jgi:hypothetical protein